MGCSPAKDGRRADPSRWPFAPAAPGHARAAYAGGAADAASDAQDLRDAARHETATEKGNALVGVDVVFF